MSLAQALSASLRALAANKGRSLLTMLGVTIGVAAVVTMVSLGQGASRLVADQINALGTNVLWVQPGTSQQGGISYGLGTTSTLTLADARAVTAGASAVKATAPVAFRFGQIVWRNHNAATSVVGTTPSYSRIRSWPTTSGRFLSPLDVNAEGRVADLGATLAKHIFGRQDPVGHTILINGVPFRVIGLMSKKGTLGSLSSSMDNEVFIPVTTLMFALFRSHHLTGILVWVRNASLMGLATNQVRDILHFRHDLPPTAPDDFQIVNQTSILRMTQKITGALTFLLGGIGAISLLVGGIGIMNIMLVSVTERTREVGIRRAVGARRSDILVQFLLEALALSLTGGVIGIILGMLLAAGVAHLGHFPAAVSPPSVLVAFCFSALVGVVFGVYPAHKASRLNLVDALRYE